MENPLTYLQKKKDLVHAYKRTFASADGKLVLEDLMKRYLVVKDTPVSTPERSHEEKCKRSVVIYVLNLLSFTAEDRINAIMQRLEEQGVSGIETPQNNIETQIFNIPTD